MQQDNARRVALGITSAVVLYLCWLIVRPFVQVMLWSTVLAVIAYPAFLWLRRRGRGPNMAAVLTTLLVVLTVIVPAAVTAILLYREAAMAAPVLDDKVKDFVRPDSAVMRFAGRFMNPESLARMIEPQNLAAKLAEFRGAILSVILANLGNLLGVIVQAVLVVFTLFYFVRDADRIVAAVRGTVPLESEQSQRVFQQIYSVISASVYGVLMIAALQGALGGIAFAALRIPSPILWGIVMFLLSMIPLAGSVIVWGPVALYLLATGHWVKATFLIIWGTLVIGMLDNLLRPRLVGQKTKLHELVVFFAVLGGLQVFGMLGIVVGPVVLAVGLALSQMLLGAPVEKERPVGPPA